METIRVKKLSGYISAIKRVSKTLKCDSIDIWYRGISDDSYNLVPGIIWRNIDESHHSGILEDWLNTYILYSNETYNDGYDVYALAQHYGLPTRLLDWTTSPLTALFFALEKEEKREKRIVWSISPSRLNQISTGWDGHFSISDKFLRNKYELDKYLPEPLSGLQTKELKKGPIALRVQPKNRRISSQKGCFTLHGTSKDDVDKILSADRESQIVKIEINGSATRNNLLNEIRLMGITEDSIFQDLTSLSERLKREWGVKS